MKKNKFSLIFNAYKMVKKNIKSYSLLSVTIILSFSLLLIYLIFSDSKIYNNYKKELGASSNIYILYGDNNEQVTKNKFNLLENKLKKNKNVLFYQYFEHQTEIAGLNNIENIGTINCYLEIIPSNAFAYYESCYERLSINNKNNKISLKKNQVIVDENLYKLLKVNTSNAEKVFVDIPIRLKSENVRNFRFEVVGTCKNSEGSSLYYDEYGKLVGPVTVLVSPSSFENYELKEINRRMIIYSQNIKETTSLIENLYIEYSSAYVFKQNAMSEINISIEIKTMFVIVLIMLLGINMLTSFLNVLEKRKFEIGVRRAIGAGKCDIIKQFFYEGIILMFFNIFISIGLVVCGFCIYKWILLYMNNLQWTIIISKYTILIFLCSSIFLSLFFSLLFGIQSTKVEIVKYLKEE